VEIISEFISKESIEVFLKIVRKGVLISPGATHHENIRRLNLIKHRLRLTAINKKNQFPVHSLLISFLEDFSQIFRMKHICILNFKEILATVAVHVDNYPGVRVC